MEHGYGTVITVRFIVFLSYSLWSFDLFLCTVFLLAIRLPCVNKLELSWVECQEDVAAPTSSHHTDLSPAHCIDSTRLKLSTCRSSPLFAQIPIHIVLIFTLSNNSSFSVFTILIKTCNCLAHIMAFMHAFSVTNVVLEWFQWLLHMRRTLFHLC